ncbi:protein kinase C delta type-like [Lithobates pipiens]
MSTQPLTKGENDDVNKPLDPPISGNKPSSLAEGTSCNKPFKKLSLQAEGTSCNSTLALPIPAPSISPGSDPLSLASFTFHCKLGEGGFGMVLLASHSAYDHPLAVKLVRKSRVLVEGGFEVMVEREVLEETRHNVFCTHMFGAFQTNKYLVFVMEYLSGGDLEHLIQKSAPISSDAIRYLAADIICGLRYLHSKGIIHRDIKPANILLSSTGHAKICDFGLSVRDIFQPKKYAGQGAGTNLYCAPEVHNRQPYDAMVDYFSLGILLYEMATGEHPLCDCYMSDSEVADAINQEDPMYPPEMIADLKDLIRRLLRKNPERRRMDLQDVQEHPFFQGINWTEVELGQSPPISHLLSLPSPKAPLHQKFNMAYIMASEERKTSITSEDQRLFINFKFMSEGFAMKTSPQPSESPPPPDKSCTVDGEITPKNLMPVW